MFVLTLSPCLTASVPFLRGNCLIMETSPDKGGQSGKGWGRFRTMFAVLLNEMIYHKIFSVNNSSLCTIEFYAGAKYSTKVKET